MQEFIQMAVQQLNMDQEQASSATTGIFKLLEDQMDGGQFQSLISQLPGAEQFLASAAAPATSGGGGGLLGGLAGALGGGGIASLASGLLSGVSGSQMTGLADLFLGYVKQHAGDELAQHIEKAIPMLSKLVA